MKLISGIIIAILLPLIISFILLVLTVYPQVKTGGSDISGFWVAKIDDALGSQKFVFHFTRKEDGTAPGEIHSYLNSTKLSNSALSEFKLDGTDISMVTNSAAHILYKGKVDFRNGTISGRLIYNNGKEREMNLVRYDDGQLLL